MSDSEDGGSLSHVILDAGLPDITGIPLPAPVKRSLWRALGRLITGAVEVPVAYLEAQAGKIRAHGKGTEAVTLAAATAAAQRFGSDMDLADRAVNHFGAKIIQEQMNREAVARAAVEAIAASPPETATEVVVDEDWLTEFTEIAAKKSNKEIQAILGRILAGEISKPGTFSPATLQLLTTLSQTVARKFQLLSGMSIADAQGYTFVVTSPFPEFQKTGLLELGITYSDFLNLQSAGLLAPALISQLDLNSYVNTVRADYVGQPCVLSISDISKKLPNAQITLFSNIGHELRSVIPLQLNDAYDIKLRTWLASQFSSIEVTKTARKATQAW